METETTTIEAKAIIDHLYPRHDAELACRVLIVALMTMIQQHSQHKRVQVLSLQRLTDEIQADMAMKGKL